MGTGSMRRSSRNRGRISYNRTATEIIGTDRTCARSRGTPRVFSNEHVAVHRRDNRDIIPGDSPRDFHFSFRFCGVREGMPDPLRAKSLVGSTRTASRAAP